MRSLLTLIILVLIIAVTLGLSQLSGTTSIELDDNVITLSTGVFCILGFLIFVVGHLILRIISFLLSVPSRLLSTSPSSFPQVLSEAFVELAAGDPNRAGRSIRKLERIDPKFALLPLLKAKQAKLNGDSEGEKFYLEHLSNDPRAALLGYQEMYRRAEHEGQVRLSYEIALKAHELAPKKPWTNHALIIALSRLELWPTARAQLRKGWKYLDWTRSQKARAEISLLIEESQELWAKDEKLEGYRLAKSAYAKDSQSLPAALEVACYAAEREDYNQLTKILKACWLKTPHPKFIDIVEGSKMPPAQKIKLWQKLYELNPAHPLSQLGLISCLVHQQAFGRAKEHLQEMDPKDHDALYYDLMAKTYSGLEEEALAARYAKLAEEAPRSYAWSCLVCNTPRENWTSLCSQCKSLGSVNGVTLSLPKLPSLD